MDKKVYHIIKQHHNFNDRPVDDRAFLRCYSKFSAWLIPYQLTTKTDYIVDLYHFMGDAKRSNSDGIADLSKRILDKIEPHLPDNRVYDISDISNNYQDATPITWGELNELADREYKD